MTMMRIRLELGRTNRFPNGNENHAYEFVAPLTPEGHIDEAAWRKERQNCLVQHLENGNIVESGRLSRVGRSWRFDYDRRTHADDEPFYKLDQHVMRPGLYVSIVEHDGIQKPFKIVSVVPTGINPADRRP
jgi:hypothetical protein